jgi:hypothetical protein
MASALSGAPDLGERFELLELLGAGTSGRVFRARDARYGLEVALKVLTTVRPEALRAFKQEFRALAHVSHPNLVALYELHAHGDTWFYTMEHVPGGTLKSWARAAARTHDALRGAAFQLASGIAALHEAGLLHRDVKPSNVLVGDGERVVVGDFGFVGALDPTRGVADDRVLGTLAYSAPEVWSGAPVGPAADWYSFGVTLFELLAARLPFAPGPAHLRPDGPAPSESVEGVPDDLDQLCTRLLRRDPAARPTAQECLAVLAGRASPATTWTASSQRFVGRDLELEALSAALDHTRTHGSSLHLVRGASGIGKTALVEEVARRARSRGAIVLRGRCHPQDALSARGLDAVVDALGRHVARAQAAERAALVPSPEPALARMFPTLTDVLPTAPERALITMPGKEERQAALGALARILARVAAARPLLILVDDLHWADDETGSALVSLLEGLEGAPGVLFVGTYRADHEETSRCVSLLREAIPNATTLALGPLPAASAEALARGLLHAEDAATLTDVLEAARGNPYLVQELAAGLRARTEPASAPPSSPPSAGALLDRVVLARVGRLTASARRVLEILTIAELPLPASVVMEAAGVPEREYLGDLTALRAQRLVSPRLSQGHESLEPYHAQVREVLARSLSEDTRPSLHRSLARAYEHAEASPHEAIARHYLCAEERTLAYEHALAAADEARASLAFGRAAAMLDLAARTGIATPEEERELRAAQADALANAGHGEAAARLFLELASRDDAGAAEYERRAADQLLFNGHLEEGLVVLGRVLARVGLSLPRSRVLSVARVVWAQALGPGRTVMRGEFEKGPPDPSLFARIDACHTATLGLTMTDPLASAVMQAQHLGDALRARDPGRLARALGIHLVHTAGGWHDPERTRRIALHLDELARAAASPTTGAMVALSRAGAAWMEGRLEECLEESDRAIAHLRQASCVGMQWHLDTHHLMELEVLETLGRWDELGVRLRPYLQDARERGDRFLEAGLRVRFAATLGLARGDVTSARAEVEEARRLWARPFDLVSLYAYLRLAWCALYEGDAEQAHRTMVDAHRQMERSLLVRVVFYRDLTAAAHARTLLARAATLPPRALDRALDEVRRTAAALAASGAPVPRAHAKMLEASADRLAQRDSAPGAYESAASAFDAVGAALLSAACRHRARGELTLPRGVTLEEPVRILEMLAP